MKKSLYCGNYIKKENLILKVCMHIFIEMRVVVVVVVCRPTGRPGMRKHQKKVGQLRKMFQNARMQLKKPQPVDA